MAAVVLRRLLWLVPVLLFVVVVTFAFMHLAPGNPWDMTSRLSVGQGGTPLAPYTVRDLQAVYGLDQPWWQQLVRYLWNAVHLNFGTSYLYQGHSVRSLLFQSFPVTFTLGALALAVIVVAGVGGGVLAALRRGSLFDHALTGFASLATSAPDFVVGIFLILGLSVYLRKATGGSFYLPDSGFGLDARLVLPVAVLSLHPVALVARLARGSVLQNLHADHVRTAKGKGVARRRLVVRHVLRNSLIPLVTVLGPIFAFLITGTVVIGVLFGIPGLGGLFATAVTQRDYPVILGGTITYVVIFVLANLASDLLYMLVDPRVRPG